MRDGGERLVLDVNDGGWGVVDWSDCCGDYCQRRRMISSEMDNVHVEAAVDDANVDNVDEPHVAVAVNETPAVDAASAAVVAAGGDDDDAHNDDTTADNELDTVHDADDEDDLGEVGADLDVVVAIQRWPNLKL